MRKYSLDGVDVEAGDEISSFAYAVCQRTYDNSPFVQVEDLSGGHFRGPRGFRFVGLPAGCFWDGTPDGNGTKVIATDAAMNHRQASRDWMAMCGGDLTRWGGLPLLYINILDAKALGKPDSATRRAFEEMFLGMAEAANEQQVVLWKGETAELGPCVGTTNPTPMAVFNWGGVAIGVYHPDKMITGKTLAAGQTVIALKDGFRSNGWSSVREAFRITFGDDYHNNEMAKAALREAAEPSVLYDRLLATMNGWFRRDPLDGPIIKMHLVAHITGGAIKSKFGEDILFRMGLSANLSELWEPSRIMKDCAKWRGITDEEAYETWNGGQGALVVVDNQDADAFVAYASDSGIEAKICGQITKEDKPQIQIISGFSGNKLTFYPKAA